jgi:hypothetical protein
MPIRGDFMANEKSRTLSGILARPALGPGASCVSRKKSGLFYKRVCGGPSWKKADLFYKGLCGGPFAEES